MSVGKALGMGGMSILAKSQSFSLLFSDPAIHRKGSIFDVARARFFKFLALDYWQNSKFLACGRGCNASSWLWWLLEVCPMHKDLGYGTPYVALCFVLDQTSFKPGYTMNAVFMLSMYNHSNINLYSKGTYGETFLISLKELLKSSDYLLDDTCVFGVEILQVDMVKKKPVSVQNLFLQKEFIQGAYTWTMNNFLDLDLKPSVRSPVFEICGRHFVFAGKNGGGWSNFIALNKRKELVGSNCIVKADITIIGSSNDSHIMV
ncbi:hypothetical protein ABZP36_030164 [Zizania latifolia]